MPDRTLLDLQRRLGSGGLEGEFLRDLAGPALYRIEPSPLAGVICPRCLHVALIPKLPAKPVILWVCSGCGNRIRLEPPAAALAAGRPLARA